MKLIRRLISRVRVLPLLLIFAALAFAVRLGDFMVGIGEYNTAYAQHESSEDHAQMQPDEMEHPMDVSGASMDMDPDAEMSGDEMGGDASGEGMEKWQDASEDSFDYSDTNVELFRDLAERRRNLEKREKELAMKEALLNAAQKELDQKVRELTAIRDEMRDMMKEQDEASNQRIESLVKVYEGMKAKDAARIFNTLDLDVLVDVMGKMSERKLSPILAQMDPERARTITLMLVQSNTLPSIVQ